MEGGRERGKMGGREGGRAEGEGAMTKLSMHSTSCQRGSIPWPAQDGRPGPLACLSFSGRRSPHDLDDVMEHQALAQQAVQAKINNEQTDGDVRNVRHDGVTYSLLSACVECTSLA